MQSCDRPQEGDRVLRLKLHWLNQVLNHNKTCEVRGSSAQAGPLWLGHGGYIYVYAVIDRVEAVLDKDAFQSQEPLHKVHLGAGAQLPYKKTWLWHLRDIKQLDKPVPYANQVGPVTWLKYSKPKTNEVGQRPGAAKRPAKRARAR